MDYSGKVERLLRFTTRHPGPGAGGRGGPW